MFSVVHSHGIRPLHVPGQAGLSETYCFYPPVRSSVRFSVTKLVKTIFWKEMNQFWYELAQILHEAGTWDDQLWWSGGQRSRSHEAKIGHKIRLDKAHSISRTIQQMLTKPGSYILRQMPAVSEQPGCKKTQRSTSHEAQIILGGLAEASLSSPVGQIA